MTDDTSRLSCSETSPSAAPMERADVTEVHVNPRAWVPQSGRYLTAMAQVPPVLCVPELGRRRFTALDSSMPCPSIGTLLELSQRLHLPARYQYLLPVPLSILLAVLHFFSSMAQQPHYFHHNSDRNMLNCKVGTASTRLESQFHTGLAWAIHNRRLFRGP